MQSSPNVDLNSVNLSVFICVVNLSGLPSLAVKAGVCVIAAPQPLSGLGYKNLSPDGVRMLNYSFPWLHWQLLNLNLK